MLIGFASVPLIRTSGLVRWIRIALPAEAGDTKRLRPCFLDDYVSAFMKHQFKYLSGF